MKQQNRLAWLVLGIAAILGSKWIAADDETRPPTSALPDSDEPAKKSSPAPRFAEPAGANFAEPPALGLDENPPAAKPAPRVQKNEAIDLDAPATEADPAAKPPRVPAAPDVNPVGPKGRLGPYRDGPAMPAEVTDALNKRSEQAVTLEWIGPAQIKVGRPFIYELVVRNTGSTVAQDVVVRDRNTDGTKIKVAEPAGEVTRDGHVWKLGEIEAQQERRIKIEMIAERKGDVVRQATVTATTPASAKFRISEPQLTLKQLAPEKVLLGDPVNILLEVANPGDGPADNVVIRCKLGEGLKHEKGADVSYEMGVLAAGETRTLQLLCSSVKGGRAISTSNATADGGLEASANSNILITQPKLLASMTGPKLRYLERAATYKITVSNPGDATANNVRLSALLPTGFKYANSTNGGQHDSTTRSIGWFVGALGPGEKREISYVCTANQIGKFKHVAAAIAQGGLKSDADTETAVEGISALLLEVVDVDDPVEAGSETAYEIRVTNQGSREAINIEIHAQVPKEMQVRNAQGPVKYKTQGQEVIFAPLPKLAPRADAIYRVFVKGVSAGDVRFRARLKSDSLTEPVIEEESTKIYSD